jgi:hypothetical protein
VSASFRAARGSRTAGLAGFERRLTRSESPRVKERRASGRSAPSGRPFVKRWSDGRVAGESDRSNLAQTSNERSLEGRVRARKPSAPDMLRNGRTRRTERDRAAAATLEGRHVCDPRTSPSDGFPNPQCLACKQRTLCVSCRRISERASEKSRGASEFWPSERLRARRGRARHGANGKGAVGG